MYDGGEPNETLFRLIEKTVRVPARVFGDMRAQLSACHIAEAAFLRLVETRGAETVKGHMHELMEYTERMTRAALRELPDGEWSFEDWIDDDGIDYGKPIRLFVTLRDRKSTRLNSSHLVISYAVFCLKKKKKQRLIDTVLNYRF